jgi:hypothetical protein
MVEEGREEGNKKTKPNTRNSWIKQCMCYEGFWPSFCSSFLISFDICKPRFIHNIHILNHFDNHWLFWCHFYYPPPNAGLHWYSFLCGHGAALFLTGLFFFGFFFVFFFQEVRFKI